MSKRISISVFITLLTLFIKTFDLLSLGKKKNETNGGHGEKLDH